MSNGLSIAVVGAGPVGLAVALLATRALPSARIAVFDQRPADRDVSEDPRTVALSIGSVQLLRRIGAWPGTAGEPILEVRVTQAQPALGPLAPEVRIRHTDEGVPCLGSVAAYGQVVTPLQQAWFAAVAADPERLSARFGSAVAAVRPSAGGVEIDTGASARFDLAVIAEGGVFADQARRAIAHDYRQTAWVGSVEPVTGAPRGVAVERFTPHGPLALLPLRGGRMALVWCVPSDADPVAPLDDRQRRLLLDTLLPEGFGPLQALSPLKAFPLGLNAERTLVAGRTVRIGNAAQTLHPVAGQGLNLGLRDAMALVQALREKRIAAGLDVFATEPLPVDDPLHELHEDLSYNVTLTAHTAWQSHWTHVRDSLVLWHNVLRVLRGESGALEYLVKA